MKIIHCADLHLGSSLTSYFDADFAATRKKELEQAWLKVIDYANKNDIKLILLAGDVFDTPKVSKALQNSFMKSINLNPQIDFIFCNGNHDEETFINKLEDTPSNLKIATNSWQTFNYDDVNISTINLNKKTENHLYETLSLDSKAKNIVMMHGDINVGANEDFINVKQLQDKNIDYLALGHIHKREVGTTNGIFYVYPGVLEGRGFDECGMQGFYVIDTDDIKNPVFVDNSLRIVERIDLDVTGVEDIEKEVRKNIESIDSKSLVKLEIIGKIKCDDSININTLNAMLSSRFDHYKVKDSTRLLIDPKKYINDNSLKGIFIKKVLNDVSLSETDKEEIIRYGIMAMLGDDTL